MNEFEEGYEKAAVKFDELHMVYLEACEARDGKKQYNTYLEMRWCFVGLDPFACKRQSHVLGSLADELIMQGGGLSKTQTLHNKRDVTSLHTW